MNVDLMERKVEAYEDRIDLLEDALRSIINSIRTGDSASVEQEARHALSRSHQLGLRV